MRYENGKVLDLKIAYVGGGSRGWAWGFMTDLTGDGQMEGTVRLYDIDRMRRKRTRSLAGSCPSIRRPRRTGPIPWRIPCRKP